MSEPEARALASVEPQPRAPIDGPAVYALSLGALGVAVLLRYLLDPWMESTLPLVTTFHTLAEVKSSAGDPEPGRRADAERVVIGCSDAVCASNTVEAEQLVDLYDADHDRIEIVPPGVDHAFFSPGDRSGARFALGLGDEPVLLFVGRIQPLKGLDVAVAALGAMRDTSATLVAPQRRSTQ